MTTIDRPATQFDESSHTYTLGDQELLGVSTIAKVGGVEETWGIASAWGFRIGYEGAHEVLHETAEAWLQSPDELREMLKKRGLTPWSKRDKAAERGTWVHDALEALAQNGRLPDLKSYSDEVQGHMRGVLKWFLDWRPDFVATEVQVTSREHGFAGRYDVRCTVRSELCDDLGVEPLFLVDLKTSKGVYPETHFPQLAGYELASVEMGYPPTDAQFVLNTHPDGTYDFVRSWATADDFIAYLGALRAIRRIKAESPEEKLRKEREAAVLWQIAGGSATSAVLIETIPVLSGMTTREVGFLMSKLRKRGLVTQSNGAWMATRQSPSAPQA